MKTRSSFAVAVVFAFLVTGSSVATGAPDTAVKKQRIAIEGTFNSGTSSGTFKLIPLTPGPLKPDSGRFQTVFAGTPGSETTIIRNGQKVTRLPSGSTDRMTGKNGTFSIHASGLEIVAAGGIYAIATAPWTFERGTGAYEGLGGGGALVAVALPGNDSYRYEGYVRAA